MSRFFKYRARHESSIELSEQDGVRSLHLGGSMVQSSMRLSAPDDLELTYTKYMMGFLLFHSFPANILMIGLGGGSLAKFVYYRMPQTKTTVIEVNPQIVTMAQNYFFLPEDDARLQIVTAEGGEYIANHSAGMDVLMVDGFDDDCQIPSLCSQNFYNLVYKRLNRDGVLVVNLLSQDKAVREYLKCIENSFKDQVIALMPEVRGNLIVFAFKRSPGKLAWKVLRMRAKALEKEYSLPFVTFVTKLRKYNSRNSNFLEF